jgi:hypothetical protein
MYVRFRIDRISFHGSSRTHQKTVCMVGTRPSGPILLICNIKQRTAKMNSCAKFQVSNSFRSQMSVQKTEGRTYLNRFRIRFYVDPYTY